MRVLFTFQWELDLIKSIQDFASPALTSIMSFFTMFGEETLLVVIILFLYLCLNKEVGRKLCSGLIVSLIAGMSMKGFFMRRRPYFDHPEISCLRAPSGKGDVMDIRVQDYSFPSMHSANSATMGGTVFKLFRQKWVRALCIAYPLLIGFSRVYLGVHYPTDVLVGWMIGVLAVAAVPALLKKCGSWLVMLAVCALLALPGWFFFDAKDFFSTYGIMVGTFLAFHLDDKCVHFSNTRNFWRSIIRLIGGFAVFLIFSEGLKIPFSSEFLDGSTFMAHLVRALRYAITSFVALGIYPMLFKHTDRIFCKDHGIQRD